MTENPSALTKWAQKALGLPEVGVEVRLRGNQLHILCEAEKCPQADYLVARFSDALASMDIESLLPKVDPLAHGQGSSWWREWSAQGKNRSRIEQIFVCGRAISDRRPEWTVKLDTNGYCSTLRLEEPSGDGATELASSTSPDRYLADDGDRELAGSAHPTSDDSHPPTKSKIEASLPGGAIAPAQKNQQSPVSHWSSQGATVETAEISQNGTNDLSFPKSTPLVKTAVGDMSNSSRDTKIKTGGGTTTLNSPKPSEDSNRTYNQRNFPDPIGHGQNRMISTPNISSKQEKT